MYIHIHGRFSLFDTNVLNGFMVSLFLAAPAPRVLKSNKPNGNISTDWAKALSFVWEKVLYADIVLYTILRFSNLNKQSPRGVLLK